MVARNRSGRTLVEFAAICSSVTAVVAMSSGQALPCIEEYTGSSCTLFLPDPLPQLCPPVVVVEGMCASRPGTLLRG